MVCGSYRSFRRLTLFLLFIFIVGTFLSITSDSSWAIGELDTTFGQDGLVVTDFAGSLEWVNTIGLDSKGRILAAGIITDGINDDFVLARYTVSGDLDVEFGNGGVVSADFAPDNTDCCSALVVASDDSVILGGHYHYGPRGTDLALVKFTASGILDTSFGDGGYVSTHFDNSDRLLSMVLDQEERIIVAGDDLIARYKTDGTLDESFGIGGYCLADFPDHSVEYNAITLNKDGKILAACRGDYDNNNVFELARYDSEGNLDTSFGDGGIVSADLPGYLDSCVAITTDESGRIFLGGATYTDTLADFALVCYKPVGSLDETFGNGGFVVNDFANGNDHIASLQIDDKGRIVVSGYVTYDTEYFALARYTESGDLDMNFGNQGLVSTDFPGDRSSSHALVIDEKNRIVLGGYTTNHAYTDIDFALARYITNIIDVTNTNDNGLGSLRNALDIATDGDQINLNVMGSIILNPTYGELIIDKEVTIQGPGADLLSISGGGSSRVLYIEAVDTVNISDLSIISGDATGYDHSDPGALYGGGIYNRSENLAITDCTISGNKSGYDGAGMFNCSCTNPTLTNCTFTGNSSNEMGGGVCNWSDSTPTLTNCTFTGNSANQRGGGMYNYYSSPEITNCTFNGNSAAGGGGICNCECNPTLINCTFNGNTSIGNGGGIYNRINCSPEVTNCTFTLNSADLGGGMYNFKDSSPRVTNCIFWDAAGGEICNYLDVTNPSTPDLSYCVVQSSDVGDGTSFNNIISEDPMLAPLDDNGGPTWTCALRGGSSAIDAGTVSGAPDTDQRGISRPARAGYDIGAYERTTYIIDASWSYGGSITPASADIGPGDNVPFTVSPDEYYHINEIYVDGLPATFDPGSDGTFTYTFENVSADHLISADFALDEYSLSVTITGSGSVTTSPDFSTYPHGTEVELDATPQLSSLFSHWEDDITGSTNPETIKMTGPKSVKAVFNKKTFIITKDCGCHGDISGADTVMWDATPTYDIDCCAGFAINDVHLDGVSKGSVSSLTLEPVHANHTISATFCINHTMIEDVGLSDFSLTSPYLEGELFDGIELPLGITSDDFELISEDLFNGIYMQGVTEGQVVPFIENRGQEEFFLNGVSFDIPYTYEGDKKGILPVHLVIVLSREDIGLEYSSIIDEESSDKGLRAAFLDHVGILKVISPDVYDLLEESWEVYPEEEAKAFFEVDSDMDYYYVGINLIVVDAVSDNSEMRVQALSNANDRYFLIFDGEEDGHFKDPIVLVRKPLEEDKVGGGGGGGCNIAILPGMGLILAIPIVFLLKKTN